MYWSSVNYQEVKVKLLVSSPRLASGYRLRSKHSGLWITVRDNSIHKGLRRRSFYGIEFQLVWATETRPDEDDGFRADHSFMLEYHAFLGKKHNPDPLQQVLEEQLLDQSLKFKSWKFLTNMDLTLQFHHPMIENGHPTLWFPQEESRFVDEVSYSQCRTQI